MCRGGGVTGSHVSFPPPQPPPPAASSPTQPPRRVGGCKPRRGHWPPATSPARRRLLLEEHGGQPGVRELLRRGSPPPPRPRKLPRVVSAALLRKKGDFMISCSGSVCWRWWLGGNALLRFLPAVGTVGDRAGGHLSGCGGVDAQPWGPARSLTPFWGCSPIPFTPSLWSPEQNPQRFWGRNCAKPSLHRSGSLVPVLPQRDAPSEGRSFPQPFSIAETVSAVRGARSLFGVSRLPASPCAGLVSHQLSGSQIR